MYRVLTFNQISPQGLARLPGYHIVPATGPATDPDTGQPDAILLRSHKLSPEQIPPSVVAVSRAGAGTNNIPVADCTRRGIPVFNAPGANANAVKELVAAALLLGSRGIVRGIAYVDTLAGIDDSAELNRRLEAHKKQFKGSELARKTLGVVGLGAIGSLVAEMALTLGMEVVGYDPALSVDAAWRLSSRVQKASTLEGLFERCDYISLHLPLLDTTRGLVGADLLRRVRPGTCLLNFARQQIVDTGAVLAALDGPNLRQYITDFPEPALIGREDVILMPHIGASTEEAEENCAIMAAEQLRDFLETGAIRNSVNFPALELEPGEGARLAVSNENVPKILGQLLSIFADENLNVIDMLNRSRDEVAYNLIDVERCPAADVLDRMRAVPGVINVRVVRC